MTQEQILSGNIKIAEFMGVEISDHTSYPEEGVKCYHEADLEYHSDWNWLMGVVKKIHETCSENDLFLSEEWDAIQDGLYVVDIAQVFSAVVEFIDFYNDKDSH